MHPVAHINTARIAWSLLRFIAVVENVLTCIHDDSAHPTPCLFIQLWKDCYEILLSVMFQLTYLCIEFIY